MQDKQVITAAEQAAWHAGLDEGRAQAAPAAVAATASPTFMTADQGRDWAWNKLREDVGTEGWTVMDSVNYHGFFLHGWNYRGQYELQRAAGVAALKQELTAAPAAVAVPDGSMGLLEALESMVDVCEGHDFDGAPSDAHMEKARAAISAYRAALAATPAPTVAVRADDLEELSMLNKLIDLGSKAAWAHAKSNSDDGPAGTTAYVQWQELRAEMGELIRNHYAATPPAAAAPVVTDAQIKAVFLANGFTIKEGLTDLKPYVYQAARALLAGVSAPAAQAINLLAADHSGMKVDYRGLFSQVQRAIKRSDPGYAEMLRQLEGHLQELGQRWYAGDTNVVDEILQLYCIERDARKTVRQDAAAAPQAQADARDPQLLAFAVSEIRRDGMEHEPVLYVSKGQLGNFRDPDGPDSTAHGRYLPARVTPAGKFTTPLFAVPQAQAGALAAEITWPKARDVGRFDDMSPGDSIRVGLDSDNDVYVSVCGGGGVGSVEFCNPGGGGGGKSSRTRLALLALMVAMEADNADDPARDWWARRNTKAAQQGGE